MASTHVIRRQLLDVELVGSEADGFILQERLPSLSRDWLNPALDKVLERWVPANEHWIIDRLFIDVGTVAAGDLERGISEAVSSALERRLREISARGGAPAEGPSSIRTPAESLREAFAHFLRTGVLPWWFSLPPGRTLEECAREAWRRDAQSAETPEEFAHSMRPALRTARSRARLARQFSFGFLSMLLRELSAPVERAVREILEKLGGESIGDFRELEEAVWESAFAASNRIEPGGPDRLIAEAYAAWSRDGTPSAAFVERIEKLWPGATRAAGAASPAPSTEHDSADDSGPQLALDQGVFVGCAGVVLLHPFLPRFFEALGVARDEALLQPERALALLHFLATGQRAAPEHDLLLAKFLCNVPAGLPVRSRVELTAADEEEAGSLLDAVIRHWDALGETSVDGLRGSFLARPGKLSRRGEADVLQVEARAYDILLDRLPWGIGLVQLPWMKKSLWVEWRF